MKIVLDKTNNLKLIPPNKAIDKFEYFTIPAGTLVRVGWVDERDNDYYGYVKIDKDISVCANASTTVSQIEE